MFSRLVAEQKDHIAGWPDINLGWVGTQFIEQVSKQRFVDR